MLPRGVESKVEQFVALCERLRAENSDLRQQLAAAQNDAKRLHEKIEDVYQHSNEENDELHGHLQQTIKHEAQPTLRNGPATEIPSDL